VVGARRAGGLQRQQYARAGDERQGGATPGGRSQAHLEMRAVLLCSSHCLSYAKSEM